MSGPNNSSSHLSPVQTGLRGRCPSCGEGTLFQGFLTYAPHCEACGTSFEMENAGDGPAVFVIFLAGFIIIPLAIAFHYGTGAPFWLTLVIWLPILTAFCLALLRPLRGLMFNLQWATAAKEAEARDLCRAKKAQKNTPQSPDN